MGPYLQHKYHSVSKISVVVILRKRENDRIKYIFDGLITSAADCMVELEKRGAIGNRGAERRFYQICVHYHHRYFCHHHHHDLCHHRDHYSHYSHDQQQQVKVTFGGKAACSRSPRWNLGSGGGRDEDGWG